jgi:serine protease Do
VVLGAAAVLGAGPSAEVANPAPAPGAASRAWLGVWLADSVDGGVEVVALVPDGPIQRAGVRVGDVILEANDHQLTDQAELGRLLTDLRPGDRLRLRLLRAGEPVHAQVQVSQRRPSLRVRAPRVAVDPPVAPSFHRLESMLPGQRLGLQVVQVTPDLRMHYGAPADVGVLVTRAEPGRPAEQAGIRVGDVLIKLGELEIGEPAQFERSLLRWNWKHPLELTVVREGASRVLFLNPPVSPTGGPAPTTERDKDVLLEVKRQEIKRLQRRIEQLRVDIERLTKEP